MQRINEDKAISLLKKYADSEKSFLKVLRHVKAVQKVALRIASQCKGVDIELIRIGSLLHDIGRFSCPPGKGTCRHGLIGAKILGKEGLSEIASIAERHLGAGISKEEVISQGLELFEINNFIVVY